MAGQAQPRSRRLARDRSRGGVKPPMSARADGPSAQEDGEPQPLSLWCRDELCGLEAWLAARVQPLLGLALCGHARPCSRRICPMTSRG